MPFLFKLSKRMARIRCAIRLLATAALAAGARTGTAARLVGSSTLRTLPQNHVTDVLGVLRRRNPAGRPLATDWSPAAARL
jgi:hypothetical protein